MSRRLVAIHQPNFFPWLGYFHKFARAEVFLFLDNVQFPKTGGTWINRVKLLVGGKPTWVTAPVERTYHGLRNVNEVRLNDSVPWREKLCRTIEINYRRAPFFAVVYPSLAELIGNRMQSIAEYNMVALRSLVLALGLDVSKFACASSLGIAGQATDLLLAAIKAVSGTAYLCGGGAGGYQEDEKFQGNGVELIYQDFSHPEYPQFNAAQFVPGLSIIDALMNCGFSGVRNLLLTGSSR